VLCAEEAKPFIHQILVPSIIVLFQKTYQSCISCHIPIYRFSKIPFIHSLLIVGLNFNMDIMSLFVITNFGFIVKMARKFRVLIFSH